MPVRMYQAPTKTEKNVKSIKENFLVVVGKYKMYQSFVGFTDIDVIEACGNIPYKPRARYNLIKAKPDQ